MLYKGITLPFKGAHHALYNRPSWTVLAASSYDKYKKCKTVSMAVVPPQVRISHCNGWKRHSGAQRSDLHCCTRLRCDSFGYLFSGCCFRSSRIRFFCWLGSNPAASNQSGDNAAALRLPPFRSSDHMNIWAMILNISRWRQRGPSGLRFRTASAVSTFFFLRRVFWTQARTRPSRADGPSRRE